jgi:hypothetical protein
MNKKVYVIMESVGDQSKVRVVYAEKERAKRWIGGACLVEDKDAGKFTIDEVEGVGF